MTVLVAYASALGSTREIAEHIASRMAGASGEVECRSVEEVTSVSGYEAVLAGSAIHNQAWLRPALLFFTHHAPELANRPFWAFSVGMSDALPKPFRRRGAALQQKSLERALPPEVPLRGHKVFSAAAQPRHPVLSGTETLVFELVGDEGTSTFNVAAGVQHACWAAVYNNNRSL